MGKTTRKRAESFREYFKYDYFLLNRGNNPFGWWQRLSQKEKIKETEQKLKRHKYRYHSDLFWSDSVPKHFRKRVNKERKAKDKVELYKEIHFIDYIGNYSKWNGKDNDHWSWY